ncbi:MAG: RNA 3'-terminal phosphate cyclase, partial [Myxococcota bacterium]
MIEIDGSVGEGGGQIVRSSLALSALTGKPFKVQSIRAGRKRPGLLRQHLTGVTATAEICSARLDGAELKSQELVFEPGEVRAGDYHYTIGTAGSALLVLQTILPPLLRADGPSRVTLEGGTHNPAAPPFEFIGDTFVPVLGRMGASVRVRLLRPGFYPAGGGKLEVEIDPVDTLRTVSLLDRGEVMGIRGTVIVAGLSRAIAEKEAHYLSRDLEIEMDAIEIVEVTGSRGPGNVILVHVDCATHTEVFSGFGAKGVPAPRVVAELATEVRGYLAADAPVGVHLADQLMIPFALAGG